MIITCWPVLAHIIKDFPEDIKTMVTDTSCCFLLRAGRALADLVDVMLTDVRRARNKSDGLMLLAASDYLETVRMQCVCARSLHAMYAHGASMVHAPFPAAHPPHTRLPESSPAPATLNYN